MGKKTSVTAFLKQLGNEITEKNELGEAVTRNYKLAETIWQKAIGGVEFDPVSGDKITKKPEPWAMRLVLDRCDGKLGSDSAEKGSSAGIGERIDDTKAKTLNAMAKDSARKNKE